MNVIFLRHGVGEWKGHFVARAGEVNTAEVFGGNESHFEGRITVSQGFCGHDRDFSKRQVFLQLCKTEYPISCTLVGLPLRICQLHIYIVLWAPTSHRTGVEIQLNNFLYSA